MNRDELKSMLYELISKCNRGVSRNKVAENVDNVMQHIDNYVEMEVIKARLKVMKNFKAI